MSGVDFAPASCGKTGATTTVDLCTVLYRIEATYFDPIKKSLQPLPPHYFALYQPDNVSIMFPGSASGADGRSVIQSPKKGLPAGEYALALYPFPDAVRAGYMANGEAFIDLEKNDWVAAPPAGPRLEKRKLLRIPSWTSLAKAATGFSDAPPKAKANFEAKGRLKSAEIEPFGTPTSPWKLVIDHNWIRAHVAYRFVNWKDGKEEILPPGLVVDATDDAGNHLASGSAIDGANGTAYVLIPQNRDKWKSMHFSFRAPSGTRVDLSAAAGSPDQRLTATGPIPANRTLRNTLPNLWHSLGMWSRYAPTPGGALKPATTFRTWKKLRDDIAADAAATEPVVEFHLDDAVLWNDGPIEVENDTRFTMFDHLLGIRRQDAALPHLSTGSISSPLLLAETLYQISGPVPAAPTTPRDLGTRLVNVDALFYDLEEKRVTGTPGKTEMLGARAAVAKDHAIADYHSGSPHIEGQGFYQVHFVPVPSVQDPKTNTQLAHLMLYVPCKLEDNGIATADFFKLMGEASERWSQGSPGVAATSKDYRILAKDPGKRDLIVRLRGFFSIAKKSILTVQLVKGGNRSNVHDPFIGAPKLEYFDGSMAFDKARSGGFANDSDGVSYAWHTLAHEFGHVLGLPDEYGEELSPSDVDPSAGVQNPRVPGYSPPKEGMPTDYRPFYSDRFAQMNQNTLPRLRHVRHQVQALNVDKAFGAVPNRPYVIRHEPLGIEYVRPIDESKHPYVPQFADKDIPGGHGECALFPVGQDEGVAEAMFVPPGAIAPAPLAAANRFDGLLVVRSRVRFKFSDAVARPKRWALIWNDFIQQIYDAQHRTLVRFALTGGSKLSRIAVLVQPCCDVGTAPFTSDDVKFVIDFKTPPPANPFQSLKVGSSLDLDLTHFRAISALRLILGVPTATTAGPGSPVVLNTAPLGPADFVNVAKLVDKELGDAAGTRTVVAI